MFTRFNQKRIDNTREAMRPLLGSGETLLEACPVKYAAGIGFPQEIWIGLTEWRLILMKPKHLFQALSIPLGFIASMKVAPITPYSRKPALQIRWLGPLPAPEETEAPQADLSFSLPSFVTVQGDPLGAQFNSAKVGAESGPALQAGPELLDLVKGLQTIGAQKEAQALLLAGCAADSSFPARQDAQELRHVMIEGRLANRMAAIIFGVVLLYGLWMASTGKGLVGCGAILALVAIVDLLVGNSAVRSGALTLVILTAGLNILIGLMAASPVDLIMWASFLVAMLLLLVGKPNRMRIELGVGVFTVGSIGIFAVFILGLHYFPNQVRWLMPASASSAFVDDFSADRKWFQSDSANITYKREKSAYYLTVKTPGMMYFSLAPVSYWPERGEVDVQVLDSDTSGQYGYFGMMCNYQKDERRYYLVTIDPFFYEYLVSRVDGEDEVALTDPAWQNAKGMKMPDQVNRIGLTCADNQITLTINGVAQPVVQVPGMAQFGAGKMGLMAGETDDEGATQVKVVFDNARFWPPE